jgi:hypothetical protein
MPSSAIAVITFNSVPRHNLSWKYERLGPMALVNRRQYCERHGYAFLDSVPELGGRPACWAKIPAILRAFREHEWVLWADSDTLIFEPSRSLDELCDSRFDLLVQSHDEHFRRLGIAREVGLARMPINTGVFLLRRSAWSIEFLTRSFEQVDLVDTGAIWNGIGEQEAMTRILLEEPAQRAHVGYVEHLQNHPKYYQPGDLFVHFYGNHARHHLPAAECEETLSRWERLTGAGEPFPEDRCRFHWCCIQNKDPASPAKGGLSRYSYDLDDISMRSGRGIALQPRSLSL